MHIKRTIDKLPGGMMVLPLLTGAAINTFAPRFADTLGSFTGALFKGGLPILAAFLFCLGASISLSAVPQVVRKGGALMLGKLLLGLLAAWLLGRWIGVAPVANGWLAGLSTLAVVAAINDTNGGLYMALMEQYGSPEDAAAYSVMSIESGPFLTMVSLGVAGLAGFPWQTLVGAVLPLLLGMLVGNLDPEMKAFLMRGAPVFIPFFAFGLGATLDLRRVWGAGLLGIALGVLIFLISAACLIGADRLTGGNGTAGVAASTTAGNAAAVPLLVATANPIYAPAAASATVLVAASVVVSALLAPPLTALWHRKVSRSQHRVKETI